MSELWAQLKPQLESLSKPYPHAAIELANAHRDEVAPFLVDCLEALVADPARDGDYMLHLYAMHLLACWRDTRAYRPLVQLGHLPEDVIEELLGDHLTESYGRALASVCDGNLRPLQALAEDADACIWSRNAALTSMTIRALEGDADRDALIDWLAALGEREAQRLGAVSAQAGNFELIDGVVSNATDLGAVAMLPAIRQWFADRILDESIADEKWVATHIVRSPQEQLAELRRHNNSYLSDADTEMSWWACFDDRPAPAFKASPSINGQVSEWPAEKPQTIVRDTPKLGRNDPCPCGSGRKYKKCHGSAL